MILSFIELFIGGVIVGSSMCLLVCSPILIPYLVGTSDGWKKAFVTTIVFSLGRIAVYVLYGFIIGLGKQFYIDNFFNSRFNVYIQVLAGLFVFVVGFLLILGGRSPKLCPGLDKLFIKKNLRTVFILGVFMGISPCPAMIAAFAYIFIKAETLLGCIFLVTAFGLGTSFSPLLLVGPFLGFVTQKISRAKLFKVIKVTAALILMLWGFQIIASRMGFI